MIPQMKILVPVAALTFLASSCATPLDLKLPEVRDNSGLRIEVTDALSQNMGQIIAITGVATNTSKSDYKMIILTFPLYFEGVKVGDAMASTQSLEAGRSWAFDAPFILGGVRGKRIDEVGKPKVQKF